MALEAQARRHRRQCRGKRLPDQSSGARLMLPEWKTRKLLHAGLVRRKRHGSVKRRQRQRVCAQTRRKRRPRGQRRPRRRNPGRTPDAAIDSFERALGSHEAAEGVGECVSGQAAVAFEKVGGRAAAGRALGRRDAKTRDSELLVVADIKQRWKHSTRNRSIMKQAPRRHYFFSLYSTRTLCKGPRLREATIPIRCRVDQLFPLRLGWMYCIHYGRFALLGRRSRLCSFVQKSRPWIKKGGINTLPPAMMVVCGKSWSWRCSWSEGVEDLAKESKGGIGKGSRKSKLSYHIISPSSQPAQNQTSSWKRDVRLLSWLAGLLISPGRLGCMLPRSGGLLERIAPMCDVRELSARLTSGVRDGPDMNRSRS